MARSKTSKKPSGQKKSRRELKQKAVEMMGGACENCGYNKCLAALTFHHLDPTQKDFAISDLINVVKWSKIKEELSKCKLLCSNCHVETHHILDGYK